MKKLKIFPVTMAFIMSLSLLAACNKSPATPEEPVVEPTVTYQKEFSSSDYSEIDYVGYTTWYFDFDNGDNDNSGKSEEEPLKSLEFLNRKIRTASEENPVRILIKAGSSCEGEIVADDFSATAEKPLVIDSYGKTEENPYAGITGTTPKGAVVTVSCSNIRISGLEISGERSWRGIWVRPTTEGALENVVISDNYIHDLNFSWQWEDKTCEDLGPNDREFLDKVYDITPEDSYDHAHGAIIFTADTNITVGPSWFENVWVENNVMERCSRVALWLVSYWAGQPGINWMGNNRYCDDENGIYWNRNVNIRGNYCNYIGGDGMVMIGCRDSIMEYNVCYNAAYLVRTYNAGIWIQGCKDVVMQYNEAAYTWRIASSADGQGFDIDIACRDIVFQYNYAHHNGGGAMLICNNETFQYSYDEEGNFIVNENGALKADNMAGISRNIYVRNNVFADNGIRGKSGSFEIVRGGMGEVYIENNIIVLNDKYPNQPLFTGSMYTGTIENGKWYFRNNIFVSKNPDAYVYDLYPSAITDMEWDNNVFWNFTEDFISQRIYDEGVLVVDPQIDITIEAQDGWEHALDFAPKNTEIFTMGKKVTTKMSVKDFVGNNAENKFYVGAFCA